MGINMEFEIIDNILENVFYYKDEPIIEIPNGVFTIGNHAFHGFSKVEKIILSDSIKTIGSYSFCDCANLKEIIFPDSLIEIGEFAFYYCNNLTSVNIPDSVITIGSRAFFHCLNMRKVKLPNKIKKLNECLFTYNIKLSEIKIPDSVEYIGMGCFSDCPNLKEITIPKSVKFLGDGILDNCISLNKLNILNLDINVIEPCNINGNFILESTPYESIYKKLVDPNSNKITEFVKFLNSVNEDSNIIFNYIGYENLKLEDMKFLLSNNKNFTGLNFGMNYGI